MMTTLGHIERTERPMSGQRSAGPVVGGEAIHGSGIILSGSGGASPAVWQWDLSKTPPPSIPLAQFGVGYSVYALAVSPSGRRVAAGTRAGLMRVLALDEDPSKVSHVPMLEVFHGRDLSTGITGLSFLSDSLLVSAGQDGSIRVWDIERGVCEAEWLAHPGGVVAIRAIGALVLASIGMDGVLRVWDLDSLKAEFVSEPFALPRIAALTGLDFDRRSGLLVHACGTGDLHAYEVKTGFAHRTIPAHRGDFCALAFGVAGLVTAGLRDGTISLWTPQLDAPRHQASVSSPVISIAWASPDLLMTIAQEGYAQLWSTSDGLRRCADGLGSDLRVCAGHPVESIVAQSAAARHTWLRQKLTEAEAVLKHADAQAPEKTQEIARALHSRGFGVEACLVLSRFAHGVNRPVWELEALLAAVDHTVDPNLRAAVLFSIGDVLEQLSEPAMAVEYFTRAAALNGCAPQVEQRIRRLQGHPWMGISAAGAVRTDLMKAHRFQAEVEKYTLLDKKFAWRVLAASHILGREKLAVDLEIVVSQLRKTSSAAAVPAYTPRVERTVRVGDSQRQAIHWLYIAGTDADQATAYALEPQGPAECPTLVSHAIFDAARIAARDGESTAMFNQRVLEAWKREKTRYETKEWLRSVHSQVKKALSAAAARHSSGW